MPIASKCHICHGTKISPWGQGRQECGVCFGTGHSTPSYDPPRRGTITGLREEDFQRIGVMERTTGYTQAEILQAVLARHVLAGQATTLQDLQIHNPGTVALDHRGRQMITGILISWLYQADEPPVMMY